MNNTVKRIKTFEIEPFGNCWNCECLQELKQYKNSHVCNAFQEEIINCQSCQSCKEFLKSEAEKNNTSVEEIGC